VPTNGTVAARYAAEIGFSLASSGEEEVIILNVVVQDRGSRHYQAPDEILEHQLGIAHQIVEELRQLGDSLGVLTASAVRVGPDPEAVILDVSNKERVDLIILGTDLRPGSNRLFLGPRVERLLDNAPCPVIVINSS
jgi:nucleotide-binding universal stress UspA family protein